MKRRHNETLAELRRDTIAAACFIAALLFFAWLVVVVLH